MQHSPEYASFLQTIFPMLGGPVEIPHLEIFYNSNVLKRAIESPSIQTAVLYVDVTKASAYLKWWKEDAPKHLSTVAKSARAVWVPYSYKDP